MVTYICGKCENNGLYRDDDRLNGIPQIGCLVCGNRWPGGAKPVKVEKSGKEPEPVAAAIAAGETITTMQMYSDGGGTIMKHRLADLNDQLFAQLERLNDKELKGDDLRIEIDRSHAVANVAKQIICNGTLILHAHKAVAQGDIRGGHKMLGIEE